jgi:hypothetical protein
VRRRRLLLSKLALSHWRYHTIGSLQEGQTILLCILSYSSPHQYIPSGQGSRPVVWDQHFERCGDNALFPTLNNFYDPKLPYKRTRFDQVLHQRWPQVVMVTRYRTNKDVPQNSCQRGERLRRGVSLRRSGNTFSELSHAFSEAACSDTKDRVYGLLSLVSPEEFCKFPIRVDYSKTTSQLFAERFDRQCRKRILSSA